MKLDTALAPNVDLDTFIVEHVPVLFDERRDLFAAAFDTPIIVSVHDRAADQRYTVEFCADGCTVERGEMIDFPVVTVAGSSDSWDGFKRHILSVARLVERQAEATDPPRRVTREFLDQFERYDGVFELYLDADDLDAPVGLSLILNDYQPPDGAPVIQLGASFELGEQLARGDIGLGELDSQVHVGGDVQLGLEIGGFLLEQFPELER